MMSTFFLQISLLIFSMFPSSGLLVKVEGLKSNSGSIRVGVYNKASAFPTTGKQYKGYVVQIKNKRAEILITDLPKGTYAIGLLHDLNGNGKMDKNMLGIPLEPYGFSNNARGTLSAPSFEEASFTFNGSKEITINPY